MNKEYKQGDKLTYTGKGFASFDKEDTSMTFIEKYHNSLRDIWVEYKGKRLLVADYEVERAKSSKRKKV